MVGADGSALLMLKMYSGNCSLTLLFVASLIYLWITEKNKGRKAILVYVSVAILALFLFPVLSYFVVTIMNEEEIYYRILWALPMGIVISYAAVKFLSAIKKKWLQAVLLFMLAIYIMVGGHLVYKSPQFSKAENWYQVPDSVVSICDAIVIPGREIKAAFPPELVQYVRQYSPYVVMPYGYDSLVERWWLDNEFEEEMSKDISNAERLTTLARQNGCHYVIINQNHVLDGKMEDGEFTLVLQTCGYDIYVDNYADLWVPE